MPTPHLHPHVQSVVVALGPAGFQSLMAHLQGNSSTSLQKLVANTYHGAQPKKKRTLNCFVAFRCYTSPIFDKFQQKERSGFVKTLWETEQSKAKWTILAKAYSIVRDEVGTNSAPMDAFLALACPEIGIVDRDAYLSTFGWELVQNGGSWELIRRFIPHPDSFPADFFTTMLSAEDVVKFVCDNGYGIPSQVNAVSSDHGSATLTMAAQPDPQISQPAPQIAQPVPQTAQTAPHVAQLALQTGSQLPQIGQMLSQAAQSTPNIVQLTPQIIYAVPQAINSAPQASQATQSGQPQSASMGGNTAPTDNRILNDPNDPNSGIALEDFLDPMPEQCNLERKTHAEPFLLSHSINAQITNANDTRPYYPGRFSEGTTSPQGALADNSDPLTYGSNAFASLATEFWNTGSEWPHDDQFVPGEQYTTFSNRVTMPDFDAFDMNDTQYWPQL